MINNLLAWWNNIINLPSFSFFLLSLAISREDHDETTNNHHHHHNRSNNKMPYNGYSEEYLDRLENGNIPADNKSYSKRKSFDPLSVTSCGRCDKENAPFLHPRRDHFWPYLSSAFVFLKLNFRWQREQKATSCMVDRNNEEKLWREKFSNYVKFSQAEMR